MNEQQQIKSLKEENEKLKAQIMALQKHVDYYQKITTRNYQVEHDYLPYEEQEYER